MFPRPLTYPPGWLWLCGLLAGAMLALRPALPIDETRYLAVGWEMWWRESWAVPYLNGRYYDGKPPLLFWLMHAGWAMFGVNEWWPRLLPAMFGAGQLALTAAIARRLWPQQAPVAELAPWLLLGSLLWAWFCSALMFDTMLGFFALASVLALLRAAQDRNARAYVWAGVALGLGVLAKGPVVFLPALFTVVGARWWSCGAVGGRRWYLGALAAAGVALLVALTWLVPMALASDAEYLRDMTLRQTLGYTVNSFSHQRPLWWYLPLLPLVLFPWSVWPGAWRALARLRAIAPDPGVRLCVLWAVGTLAIFSLISGKQAHYLLLGFPALALLLARGLHAAQRAADASAALPALVCFAGAAALFALALGAGPVAAAPGSAVLAAGPIGWAGAGLAGIGAVVLAARRAPPARQARLLAACTCAAILLGAWAITRATWPAYDVRPMSERLAQLEAAGAPLAIVGAYHGQYHFHGRLRQPIALLDRAAVPAWVRAHPGGYVLAYYRGRRRLWTGPAAPDFQSRYRSGTMALWRAAQLAADPRMVENMP
ncbi:MAG: glycosyltransferase family 39 protein [Pseudomonadota bacterium]